MSDNIVHWQMSCLVYYFRFVKKTLSIKVLGEVLVPIDDKLTLVL